MTEAAPTEPAWAHLHDKDLLALRICDLDLRVAGSPLEPHVQRLGAELKERGLRFRPYFWLSDDWYTPDGVPGIALPFYMAHPRLMRLEETQMLEVEGGSPEWCMKILRHEAGHAIENAYRLRRRRRRIELFGRSSQKYPASYEPRPYSKSFVQHLEAWYAQSHPDEDFAETFAVWLTPGAEWEKRYAGWPALKKLQFVDELMREIDGRPAAVSARREVDPIAKLTKTLREHYEQRRRTYLVEVPRLYDRYFRRMFSADPQFARHPAATTFLRRVRREVRRRSRSGDGAYQYTVDQVFEDIVHRCRELELRLAVPEPQAKLDFAVLLTVQTMDFLHSGRHRVALWSGKRRRGKLKLLALMDRLLVPPDDCGDTDLETAEWRTEYHVVQALRGLGHEVQCLGVGTDLGVIRPAIEGFRPDVVFNLLEDFKDVPIYDQNVVAYLELLDVPYTGCNSRGLDAARDKAITKKILSYHRIPVPEFHVFRMGTAVVRPKRLAFPLIVKSLTKEGSSKLSVVDSDHKLKERVDLIHKRQHTDAIVERYVDGRELYVGVMGTRRVQVLPVWEMIFGEKVTDETPRIATERVKWDAVYQKKHGIDTAFAKGLPDATVSQIQNLCRRVYRTLELSGYARIDLRLNAEGKLYVLEANPNPQIADGEDFAASAQHAGVSYRALIQRLVNLALEGR